MIMDELNQIETQQSENSNMLGDHWQLSRLLMEAGVQVIETSIVGPRLFTSTSASIYRTTSR